MAHASLLADIEAFISREKMAESTFGREALGDWRLISELRGDKRNKPRRIWPETEEKIRSFMRGRGKAKLPQVDNLSPSLSLACVNRALPNPSLGVPCDRSGKTQCKVVA